MSRNTITQDCVRWMIRRDMPEVLDIERRCFEFPWKEVDFIRALRQCDCIGMVAERGERVVGFMVYELHKSRIHMLNFAVHPEDQRCGVGTAMVAKLVGILSRERRTRLLLEVRESNLNALMFFKSMRFVAIKILRDHYEDTDEDAILMEYRA